MKFTVVAASLIASVKGQANLDYPARTTLAPQVQYAPSVAPTMEVDTADFYAPTSSPTPTCEDDKHWYHEKYCKSPPCGKSVPPDDKARPSSGFLTCRKVAKKMRKFFYSNLKMSKKNKLIAIAGAACPKATGLCGVRMEGGLLDIQFNNEYVP